MTDAFVVVMEGLATVGFVVALWFNYRVAVALRADPDYATARIFVASRTRRALMALTGGSLLFGVLTFTVGVVPGMTPVLEQRIAQVLQAGIVLVYAFVFHQVAAVVEKPA